MSINDCKTEQLLSLSDISKYLKDKRLYKISAASGLSYPTLKKLSDNSQNNYTLETLRNISNYILAAQHADSEYAAQTFGALEGEK